MAIDNDAFYGDTKPLKLFASVAVPGAVGMLAASLYGLFDGIFVGQFLGQTAFAAVNLAFPFVAINFSLADLIGVGSSVPISIALGRRDRASANNYFTCACIVIVLLGIIMGAVMWLAAPALMAAMGAEGLLAEYAAQYLRVYALFSPVCTIVFAADNYLRICGKIKTSMVLNIVMSAGILLLELLFLGVFKWGIWASPLATCLGMALVVILSMAPFFTGRMTLKFCKPRFDVKILGKMVAAGSPTFLSNVAARLASIIFNTVLLAMGGEDAVTVYGVIMYVNDIVQPLLYGVCDSLQPAIGYNYGARYRTRVKKLTTYIFMAGAAISLPAAALIFALPLEISTLFLSSPSAELSAMAEFAMRLFSITFLTRWFGFAAQSFLTAINKSLSASILSTANALILPMAFLGILWQLGLTGIWLNFGLTAAAVAALAIAIFIVQRRSLLPAEDKKEA